MTKIRDPKDLPTADEVRARLSYDPESGELTWLPRPGQDRHTRAWNTTWAGKRAGHLNRVHGYVEVGLFGKLYPAHRVIFLIVTGEWPADQVDHRDGNRTNNLFSNLRPATNSENAFNARRYSDNKSQLKGAWPTANGRYRAQITIKGRTYSLGCFATPEEAHRAYCEAAKRHFGQFARAA
jgi:hypothetical protein